jgi:hypothetical protein
MLIANGLMAGHTNLFNQNSFNKNISGKIPIYQKRSLFHSSLELGKDIFHILSNILKNRSLFSVGFSPTISTFDRILIVNLRMEIYKKCQIVKI